jgi:hypothetical protein
MADVRKGEKQIRKDQQGTREVREETAEQMRDGANSQPRVKNPNRDQARGDWDRTGDHHDAAPDREE